MERIGTAFNQADPTVLEPLLTIGDVCGILGVSKQTLYRLIGDGELVPVQVSERKRFTRSELQRYLERGTP